MTPPLRVPHGLAGDVAGGVVVGRAPGEREVKAPPVAPGRALQAASSGADPVEASGGAIAAAVRRASVEVREASAPRATAAAAPVASVVAAPVASVVVAPVANGAEALEAKGVEAKGVEAAVVLVASVVVGPVANGVEARASARVRRARGGGRANVAGGVRTGPGVRPRPALCTPSGWKSVVVESSCTATPANWW